MGEDEGVEECVEECDVLPDASNGVWGQSHAVLGAGPPPPQRNSFTIQWRLQDGGHPKFKRVKEAQYCCGPDCRA